MKTTLLSFLLLIIIFASGCFADKTGLPAPAAPTGNFTGQYRLIHTSNKGVRDTLKATLNLSMDLTTGYKVTGDTATVHAGSYGAFAVNTNNYIDFQDKTFSISSTSKKTHLNGVYQYYYDGTVFQMFAAGPLDTLVVQYDLKKK